MLYSCLVEISTAKFNLGNMHAGILIEVSSLLVNLKFTSNSKV